MHIYPYFHFQFEALVAAMSFAGTIPRTTLLNLYSRMHRLPLIKWLPVVVTGFPVCGRRACVSVWDNGTRDSNGDGDNATCRGDGSFRRRHLQLCLESRVSRGELILHVTLLIRCMWGSTKANGRLYAHHLPPEPATI